MSKVTCAECDWTDDIETIHFVDGDYLPMVLNCQLAGKTGKRKAWKYLEEAHSACDDIDDLEYDQFVYHAHVPELSHDEPGAGHVIVGVPKGFWSFRYFSVWRVT